MKAFYASQYGSMDYFGIREIAKPVPKGNQVLVKVHAVSINSTNLQTQTCSRHFAVSVRANTRKKPPTLGRKVRVSRSTGCRLRKRYHSSKKRKR
jgi:NADPH:quinone reductase-like Zn-dependent oxidoreductase